VKETKDIRSYFQGAWTETDFAVYIGFGPILLSSADDRFSDVDNTA
jgi:hypothetical protein